MPTKKSTSTTPAEAPESESPSAQIDAIVGGLDDWRGEMLAKLHAIIRQADPDVAEEVKWRKPTNPGGVPVWSRGGIICTRET